MANSHSLHRHPLKPFHLFLAILVAFCWGVNAPLVKGAVVTIPPFVFATFRCAVLGLLVLFFPRPNLSFRIISAFAFLHGAKISFLYYSLKVGLDSGLSTVLLQSQSLFAVLLAVILFRERVSLTSTMGLLIAFVGVCLLSCHIHLQGSTWGMILVLISALMAALSFLVLRDHKEVNYLSFVGYFNLVSVIPFAVLASLFEGEGVLMEGLSHLDWTLLSILGASALTVIGAYVSMVYLFSLYPTSQIVPFFLLVPLFGLSAGAFFWGEVTTLLTWGAGALVLGGLALNQYGSRGKKASRAPL